MLGVLDKMRAPSVKAHLIGLIAIFIFAASPAQAQSVPEPLSLLVPAKFIAGPAISKSLLINKPVVVTFFASWCPPCLPEFMTLNELKKHPEAQGVTIIAVNIFEDFAGKNPARMQRFLSRTNPEFPVVKGTAEIRAAFGNVTRIPTLVVYDSRGRESWRFIHEQGATKMTADLDEIVAALREAKG